MSGTNEQACPKCAAPRDPDGSPTCTCTQRTAEALRETRTAEAAAAEDFDPLRIRPYVAGHGSEAAKDTTPAPPGDSSGAARAEPQNHPAQQPTSTEDATPATPTTPAGPGDATLLTPGGPGGKAPSGVGAEPQDRPAQEFGTFHELPLVTPSGVEGAEPLEVGTGRGGGGEKPSRTPRRTVVLAAGGAVIAVLTATALATGLFSYGKPERNDALPDEVRPSVPAGSATPTATGPTGTSSASTGTGSPSPSDTASASATASAGRTATSSPSPTATRTAKDTRATADATRSADPAPGGDDAHEDPPVLRNGDDGPEVEELQLRLRQRLFYLGSADGEYDDDLETAVANYQRTRGITDDPSGVYGKATRTRLEAETDEP
ncbi:MULTISPECIES: peptidoglycan-binding domain-containing protein [unclassified Streptomyces]|uniref:peptidoglycan-binding domain-containing protein n=1 Tax=unclassified Streptomyces TaxID=2593676 RepID=UPI0004C16326|nr:MULTISPECIES: peptidoglycan-binding domain-containing protein [unclassified Streptomyces]